MKPYLDTKKPDKEKVTPTVHYLMDLDNGDLNIIRTGIDVIANKLAEKEISPEERMLFNKVLHLKSILNA